MMVPDAWFASHPKHRSSMDDTTWDHGYNQRILLTMTAEMSTVRVCVIHASATSPRVGIIDLDVTSHFS
jgi:hypothetical protein